MPDTQPPLTDAAYKVLAEESVDTMTIMRLDGLILYESPSVTATFGYQPDEIVGKHAFSFIHPTDIPHVTFLMGDAGLHPGKAYMTTLRFLHKDGSWRWIEVTARYFADNPAIPGFIVQSREVTKRIESERELQKLRKAVDASSESVFITDTEGIITYVNSEFTRLYGFMADEVVGKVTPRIIKSGTLDDAVYKEFWGTLLAKKSVQGEMINKTKDGRLVTVSGSANPILDEKGDIFGYVAIQRDITSQKEQSKALDELRKRFTLLSEGLGIGMFSSSPGEHGHFTSVNTAMMRMFEAVSVEEMLTHQVSDFYKYPEKRQQYTDKIIRDGFLKNEKIEFVTLKGRSFIGSASAVLKKLDDGSTAFDGLIEDVTAEVQTELQLVMMSRAVEQSPVSVVITDIKGTIQYVNPKFVAVTGYTKEEAVGQNPRILKSGKTPPETYIRLWETIIKGGEWHGELINKKKNGDFYTEEATISGLTNEKGDVTYYLAVKEDITERKKAETALLEKSKEALRLNELMIGRELKMIEMKEEIEALKQKIGGSG
jgi:PAS domain S-box-containing protein